MGWRGVWINVMIPTLATISQFRYRLGNYSTLTITGHSEYPSSLPPCASFSLISPHMLAPDTHISNAITSNHNPNPHNPTVISTLLYCPVQKYMPLFGIKYTTHPSPPPQNSVRISITFSTPSELTYLTLPIKVPFSGNADCSAEEGEAEVL